MSHGVSVGKLSVHSSQLTLVSGFAVLQPFLTVFACLHKFFLMAVFFGFVT